MNEQNDDKHLVINDYTGTVPAYGIPWPPQYHTYPEPCPGCGRCPVCGRYAYPRWPEPPFIVTC